MVLLTHKPNSTLAGIADAVLLVPVEQTAQFGGSLLRAEQPRAAPTAIVLELARGIPDAHRRMSLRHANLQ